MSIYVGMDVHRKRSQIAIVDDAGDQQRNRNLPRSGQAAVGPWRPCAGHSGGLRGRLRLGLAGGTGPEAAPGPPQPLQGDRLRQTQERQGRAATLAQLLRADLLPEAWIAPQQVRDLRALLRHRAAWCGCRLD
jgi:transposase